MHKERREALGSPTDVMAIFFLYLFLITFLFIFLLIELMLLAFFLFLLCCDIAVISHL